MAAAAVMKFLIAQILIFNIIHGSQKQETLKKWLSAGLSKEDTISWNILFCQKSKNIFHINGIYQKDKEANLKGLLYGQNYISWSIKQIIMVVVD